MESQRTPSTKNVDGSTSMGSVIRYNEQTGQVAEVNLNEPSKRVVGGYDLDKPYPPPRPMFFGILADGFVKVEIGDDVLTLSPTEARWLARCLGGFGEDSSLLDLNRVLAQIAPQFV